MYVVLLTSPDGSISVLGTERGRAFSSESAAEKLADKWRGYYDTSDENLDADVFVYVIESA